MRKRKWRRLDQALHDRAELLARDHPLGVVADLLELHPSQITQMRKRGWKALPKESRRPAGGVDTLPKDKRGGASRQKTEEELKTIRAKQWATRRAKYGSAGHRAGAYARSPRRVVK